MSLIPEPGDETPDMKRSPQLTTRTIMSGNSLFNPGGLRGNSGGSNEVE